MRDVALFAGGEVPDAKITRRPVGEREIAAIRRRRTRLIGVLTGPRLANAHGGFGCPVNSQSARASRKIAVWSGKSVMTLRNACCACSARPKRRYINGCAPEIVAKLVAGNHLAGVPRQKLQDVEFPHPQANAKSIAVDLELAGEIPEIRMDKTAVADALDNLVDNAIKYSLEGARVT
jgi:hypothetical protein